MEKRTDLYGKGDTDGIKALEKELLAQNAQHKDWCCTEELMKTTRDGKALYLHCLPADINGVSCVDGEVEASVFDRYRDPLYKEARGDCYVHPDSRWNASLSGGAASGQSEGGGGEDYRNWPEPSRRGQPGD